jgi:hypothetical protein
MGLLRGLLAATADEEPGHPIHYTGLTAIHLNLGVGAEIEALGREAAAAGSTYKPPGCKLMAKSLPTG